MKSYLLSIFFLANCFVSFSQNGFKDQITLSPNEPSIGLHIGEDTINKRYVLSGEFVDQNLGRWTTGFSIFTLDGLLDTVYTHQKDSIFFSSVSNYSSINNNNYCVLGLGARTRNVVCLDLLTDSIFVQNQIDGFENVFDGIVSAWGFIQSKTQNNSIISGSYKYGENGEFKDAALYQIGDTFKYYTSGNSIRHQTALNLKRNSKDEIVAAAVNSSVPFDAASDLSYTFFINEDFELIRDNIFSPSNPNFSLGKGMVIDSEDNILVTGARRSGPFSQLGTPGVVKFNPEGIYEWTSFLGNNINNVDGWGRWNSIIEAIDRDGYIVAGSESYQTTNRDTMISKAALAKISNTGDSLWMRTFTYRNSINIREQFETVIATSDGGYLAGGSSADFTAVEEKDWPWVRAIIIKVDENGVLDTNAVSVIDIGDLEAGVNMYPNPVSEQLFITQSVDESLHLQIYNLRGELIEKYESQNKDHIIIVDVATYESGVYILRAIDENGAIFSRRFVVK